MTRSWCRRSRESRVAENSGMRSLVAHCHLSLGELYRGTGKREKAQGHLTTATALYREMDMSVLAGAGGGRDKRVAQRLIDWRSLCRDTNSGAKVARRSSRRR